MINMNQFWLKPLYYKYNSTPIILKKQNLMFFICSLFRTFFKLKLNVLLSQLQKKLKKQEIT